MFRLIFIFLILGKELLVGFNLKAEISSENLNYFEQANLHYSLSDYSSAEALYLKILKTDYNSLEVNYNLANTYYKLAKNSSSTNMYKALSVYYYKKSFKLNRGRNQEVFANLKILQKEIGDEVSSNSLRVLKLFYSLSNFSVYLALLNFLIIWLLIAKRLLKGSFNKNRLLFFIFSYFLFLVIFLLGYYNFDKNKAIIKYDGYLKSEPRAQSNDIFSLKSGYLVDLKNKNNQGWLLVEKKGKLGWVSKENLLSLSP